MDTIKITFFLDFEATDKTVYQKGDREIALEKLATIKDAIFSGLAKFTSTGNRDSRLLMLWLALNQLFTNQNQTAASLAILQSSYQLVLANYQLLSTGFQTLSANAQTLSTNYQTLLANYQTLFASYQNQQNQITALQNNQAQIKQATGTAITNLGTLLANNTKNISVPLSPTLPSTNYVVIVEASAAISLLDNIEVKYPPITKATNSVVIQVRNKALISITGQVQLTVVALILS